MFINLNFIEKSGGIPELVIARSSSNSQNPIMTLSSSNEVINTIEEYIYTCIDPSWQLELNRIAQLQRQLIAERSQLMTTWRNHLRTKVHSCFPELFV